MRVVQIELVGESYAPVIEAESVLYEPDLFIVYEKEHDGRMVCHTFPWVNVRTVREWIEDGE